MRRSRREGGAKPVLPSSVCDSPAPREVDNLLCEALSEMRSAERNAVRWFAEVMRRRLFRELGYSSIYHYAGDALGFSHSQTSQLIRLCESLGEEPGLRDSIRAKETPGDLGSQ